MQSSINHRTICASPEKVYDAFSNAKAREKWLAPGDMKAHVRNFDFRAGGGYDMSLKYPDAEIRAIGKTSEKEDAFTSRFTELVPGKKLVEVIHFHTEDPAFKGEMTMEVQLKPVPEGTLVTMLFSNIPDGIPPEDNAAGTSSSLEKLAKLVESPA